MTPEISFLTIRRYLSTRVRSVDISLECLKVVIEFTRNIWKKKVYKSLTLIRPFDLKLGLGLSNYQLLHSLTSFPHSFLFFFLRSALNFLISLSFTQLFLSLLLHLAHPLLLSYSLFLRRLVNRVRVRVVTVD